MSNAEETQLVEAVSVDTLPVNVSTLNQNSLSPLVQAAMDGRLDTDKLEHMLQIQAKYEAMEAKKAFHHALAEFKANAPTLSKDRLVRYKTDKGITEYKHVSLGYALTEVNPVLSKSGLSLTFRTRQENGQTVVTATLTHEMGHSETTELAAAPDNSGGKNGIQSIASTVTYLKRHTAFALLGLEGMEDDDGAGHSVQPETITDEQVANLESLISEVGANRAQFLKVLKIDELGQLPANKYDGAVKRLEQKRK